MLLIALWHTIIGLMLLLLKLPNNVYINVERIRVSTKIIFKFTFSFRRADIFLVYELLVFIKRVFILVFISII